MQLNDGCPSEPSASLTSSSNPINSHFKIHFLDHHHHFCSLKMRESYSDHESSSEAFNQSLLLLLPPPPPLCIWQLTTGRTLDKYKKEPRLQTEFKLQDRNCAHLVLHIACHEWHKSVVPTQRGVCQRYTTPTNIKFKRFTERSTIYTQCRED